MDFTDPEIAQQIVTEYATLLERHARDDLHPASTALLPHPKNTIRAAVRTVVEALKSSGQLTGDMRAFLEEVYTSLADYVDDEPARFMAEYRQASAELAADGRRGKDQLETAAWKKVAEAGALAGNIARAIAEESEALRADFEELVR